MKYTIKDPESQNPYTITGGGRWGERDEILAVAMDAEMEGRAEVAKALREQAGPAPERDYYNGELSDLLGKTMRSVVQNGIETIDFEAETGERWQMYYEPDCCAGCSIEDVIGDLQDLVGAPIAMAEVSTNSNETKVQQEYQDESFTWTFYKLATAKGYVTIRWYGSSNGYYSETASFRRVPS